MKMLRAGNPISDSVRVLGLYVRAAVLIFAIQLVLYSVGFAAAQLPLWALLAVVCALAGLIPHIGGVLGIGFVLLFSWIAGTDFLHLAMAGGAWVIAQAIEGFWLTPRLIGNPLGLRPLVVFIVLIAGSLVFGPLGLFLAVPMLAVAMVWIRYFKGRSRRPQTLPVSSVRTYDPPTGGTGRDRDR